MDRLEAHLLMFKLRWFSAFVVCAALVVGLLRFDVRIEFNYEGARLLQVETVAGKDMNQRAVLVEIDGRPRIIRTSDWHIATRPGQLVCVEKTRFLLRRWVRYSLQLPFYCPMLRASKPNGLSSPALGPNVGEP